MPRGTQAESSDIDILIDLQEPLGWDFFDLKEYLESQLNRPSKYSLLDETLNLLKVGGFYIIDDMSPQPNWPVGHEDKVKHLLNKLDEFSHFNACRLAWATGVVICCRTL